MRYQTPLLSSDKRMIDVKHFHKFIHSGDVAFPHDGLLKHSDGIIPDLLSITITQNTNDKKSHFPFSGKWLF